MLESMNPPYLSLWTAPCMRTCLLSRERSHWVQAGKVFGSDDLNVKHTSLLYQIPSSVPRYSTQIQALHNQTSGREHQHQIRKMHGRL